MDGKWASDQDAPWTACSQNDMAADPALPTDSHTSSSSQPISGGSDELKPNTADYRVDHHLLGEHPLIIRRKSNKNIHVSHTKLTLGFQVGFISSHLTADKLFPILPKATTGLSKVSLMLEAKSIPALIIKPRLILVAHTDDLGWNISSADQMLRQGRTSIAP